jgi:hypothetical protein
VGLEGLERLKGREGPERVERLKGLEAREGQERVERLKGREGLERREGPSEGLEARGQLQEPVERTAMPARAERVAQAARVALRALAAAMH